MNILETLYQSGPGKAVAKQVGLAEPPRLRRGRVLPEGPVALGELDGGGIVAEALRQLDVPTIDPLLDVADNRVKDEKGRDVPKPYEVRPGAVIVDATGIRTLAELEGIRQILRPAMRGVERSGRIVLVATDASALEGLEAHAVAQAIDGIGRTVAKELRGGATCNVIFVKEGTRAEDLTSTISFLLDGRSAFVSGQGWRVGPATVTHPVVEATYSGRIVVVTGAARGIGAAIVRTFARDGALVVAVDLPISGDALAKTANENNGSALQLDITAEDAGKRIAEHVARIHGPDARIWAIVHNAGITRDKMLANLDERQWAQVVEVNLAAEMRINDYLLAEDRPGGLGEEGRIIGIASTSGVAGNKGQTNYAASKAGVMGYTWELSRQLGEVGVTANAVAPGFIETEMTGAIPFVQREIFRRSNSLGQGGNPVDVAELIAYLCSPASGGVRGQVIRVCGQNLVGA